MNFAWKEKKIKTKATKQELSVQEILMQPDVFMNEGALITYVVCEALTELMRFAEARAKVDSMLKKDADEQWNPETQQAEPVKETKAPKVNSTLPVEKQLAELQKLVDLKKCLKGKLSGKTELLKYSAETTDEVKGAIELRVRQTLEQMLGEIDG